MNKSQLFESFFDTTYKIKRLMHLETQEQDQVITFFQLQVLSYIFSNRNCTPSQLSEEFHMSSSAVAQLIDRLLISNWVEREHDESDRRVVHLRLTEDGQSEIVRLKDVRKKRLEPLLKHLDEKDLQELVRILQEVYLSMEKELGER